MQKKTVGWIAGGLCVAVLGGVIVANFLDTGAQSKDPTRLRTDETHTTSPAPATGTLFDNSQTAAAKNSRIGPASTPAAVYAALYSPDAEQRFTALDTVWNSAETYYKVENIVRRIEELVTDAEPRIAQLAPFVLAQMRELSGIQATPGDSHQDRYAATSPVPEDDTLANDGSEASLRMQVIEAAQIQRDEHSVAVLIQATQDTDPDNRLAAVEGLRQMLEEGFGDTAQISSVLQQSSHDPDPKVAEAAQQAIRTE